MARARKSSSASSAAAKRYCCANPFALPIMNVPRQNSGSDPSQIAIPATTPPHAPRPAPVRNPPRRPIRAISSAAGRVDSA